MITVKNVLLRFLIGQGGKLGLAVGVLLGVGSAVAGPAQAQTAVDALHFTRRAPAVGSARALGMGGVGRFGVGEGAALYYNPAGLGWMTTSEASGALAIIGAENQARFRAGNLDPTQQTESMTNYGGHLALAYKVPTQRGSLVLAGAYNQVNSFGQQASFRGPNAGGSVTQFLLPIEDEYFIDDDGLPAFDPDVPSSLLPFAAYEAGAIEFYGGEVEAGNYPFGPAILEGTAAEQTGTVTEEGRLNEVNFGAGVEAAPNVMLGASMNLSFGRYEYREVLSELDDGANDDYEVIRNGTTYQGLDEVRFEERFTSELSGINLRGGLSAEAAPGVRLGLTVETPTFYQVNEQFTEVEVTTFFDDGGSLSYGGQSGDDGTGESEYEVRTPWRLGAGGQVNLLPLTGGVADLTLAADVEFVDWSQLELSSEAFSLDDQNQIAEEDFKAVLNTNLGAELRVGEASFRAGFASRPDPDEGGVELEGGEPADARRVAFSAGAGYRFAEGFRLNVGWMQTRFEEGHRLYGEYTTLSGEDRMGPALDQEVARNRFFVGVQYAF